MSKHHYKELQKSNRTLTHLNLLLIHYNVKTTSSKHLFCLKITLQKRFILKRYFTIGCRFCPLSKNSRTIPGKQIIWKSKESSMHLMFSCCCQIYKVLKFFVCFNFILYVLVGIVTHQWKCYSNTVYLMIKLMKWQVR